LFSPAVKVAEPLVHLTPVLKYLIPKRAKSGESDYTDPEAEQYTWSYEAFPAPAAHELLKLIRRVRRLLADLTCPLLIIHSTGDQTIAPDSAQYTYERAAFPDKELVTLHNSGHVITVDSEWKTVAEKTYAFIQAHLPEEA
jgi:carboxylesterase